MATKRQKKEKAKSLIPTLPAPILRLTPAGRLYQTSSLVAQALIDADPLGIITDDPIEQMINDPEIKMTRELMDIINDDSISMVNGELKKAISKLKIPTSPAISGRDFIRNSGQFDLQNVLPRLSEDVKRTRKKTKTDKNMSKALRLANEKFRTKKGKLRKGATQAQIMKYAHKLLKKM